MVKIICTSIGVLVGCFGFAQEQAPSHDSIPKSTLESFGYSGFMNSEEHSQFIAKYRLDYKFLAQLEGFYDTYVISDRFRVSLLGKLNITEKLYLLSGADIETVTNTSQGFEKLPPRIGIINGMGYDVNDNFMLEFRSSIQINKSKMGSFGEHFIPTPQVYTLGSKFKF